MTQNQATSTLLQRVEDAEKKVRMYLDKLGQTKWRWLLPKHPVTTKNLEKIVGDLQRILVRLESATDASLDLRKNASLLALLAQLEPPSLISFDSAWEVSDLLEEEILRIADDPSLAVMLHAQEIDRAGDAHRWEVYFSKEYLERLLTGYVDGVFTKEYLRQETREVLAHIHQSRLAEYRVDRAKARLRGLYLWGMALILGALVAGLCYAYLVVNAQTDRPSSTYTLLLVTLAGASGSVLSRAIKLGKQPLHADNNPSNPEQPLGIRVLLSDWKVFFAQPIIGGTAAVIVYLVFSAGLLRLSEMPEYKMAELALVGFLAGFSEPFFLGVLDNVPGKSGGSLR